MDADRENLASEDEESDTIARVLKLAGPRPAVDPARTARVHDAVREAWRGETRLRNRRRTMILGIAGLAAAAAIAFAVRPRTPAAPLSPAAPATIGRAVAVAGILSTTAGDRLRVGDPIRAGVELRAAADSGAAIALQTGGDVRVDARTAVTFVADRELSLTSGAVYIDTGSAPHAPIRVRTPLGSVSDVGTRFEVRQIGDRWRARVRDGAIQFDARAGSRRAAAGRELLVEPAGTIVERAAAPDDAEWGWIVRAAPPFQVEGATLAAFLDWAAREGGRPIRYADRDLERTAATTTLHGSIDGLSVDEALAAILPTCGLTHVVERGHILIRRP